MDSNKNFSAEVMALLTQGRMLDAVKVIRNNQGVGLKEAKDQIDVFLKDHPELVVRLKAQQEETVKALRRWVLTLLGIAFVVWWYLRK